VLCTYELLRDYKLYISRSPRLQRMRETAANRRQAEVSNEGQFSLGLLVT